MLHQFFVPKRATHPLHTMMMIIMMMRNLYVHQSIFTWCPEQIEPPPLGNRARNGLWTGQDVRGPHRDGPGNGTELKLLEFVAVGHGLQVSGGSGGGPWNDDDAEGPRLVNIPRPPLPIRPPPPPPPPISAGGGYDAWPCGQLRGGRPGQPPGPPPPPKLHWLALGIPPPPPITRSPQNGSAVKLSWLPEHCSRWDDGGGEDCRE